VAQVDGFAEVGVTDVTFRVFWFSVFDVGSRVGGLSVGQSFKA
jgi:hypothetical protein